MSYLTPTEISTHLYGEIVDEIERNNAAEPLLTEAIGAAVDEAKSYLSNYDVTGIFNQTGNQRNKALLMFIKDIAVWHYIQLANPAVDMSLRKERYDAAIEWLYKVQRGKVVPNLPLPAPPADNNNFIKWGSNPKRGTHY
jgi:phage gp36-like protein